MTAAEFQTIRHVFGQMLSNAQALEKLLHEAQLELAPSEVEAFAESLRHISAMTIQQAAMIQQMRAESGVDRRSGQRRSGQDRRRGAGV